MPQYLDNNGLLYFWQKIKNTFVADVTYSSSTKKLQKTKAGSTSDLVTLSAVATSGSYNDLSNTPSLATVATSGSYNDLSDTPVLPDITNVYKYRGSVASAASLPASPSTGDVYNIESDSIYGSAGANVAWNGTAWDSLGEVFNIVSITNADIDTIVAS